MGLMEHVILRHLSGANTGHIHRFPLNGFTTVTVGRDPDSDVHFDPATNQFVSRVHARIDRDPQGSHQFTLTDLDSRNGTFANKERILGRRPLLVGDVIQLGMGGPEMQFGIEPVQPGPPNRDL